MPELRRGVAPSPSNALDSDDRTCMPDGGSMTVSQAQTKPSPRPRRRRHSPPNG
jgi:hypothetical protein